MAPDPGLRVRLNGAAAVTERVAVSATSAAVLAAVGESARGAVEAQQDSLRVMVELLRQTELVRPADPASSHPTGTTRVLRLGLLPDLRFGPHEERRLFVETTLLPQRPALLCLGAETDYQPLRDEAPSEEPRDPVSTPFCALPANLVARGLAPRLHNTDRRPQDRRVTPDRRPLPPEVPTATFALRLYPVRTITIDLVRVRRVDWFDPPWERRRRPPPAHLHTQRRGRELRLDLTGRPRWRRRWAELTPADEAPSLPGVIGLTLRATSHPDVTVLEALYAPQTRRLRLRLRYDGEGTPPATFSALLGTVRSRAHVFVHGGARGTLRPLPINGFCVTARRTLRLTPSDPVDLLDPRHPLTYSSRHYTALFLPYDVSGLELPLAVWPPGTTLVLPTAATRAETTVVSGTPLGEIRFFPRRTLHARVGERGARRWAPQSRVRLEGPACYAAGVFSESDDSEDDEGDASNRSNGSAGPPADPRRAERLAVVRQQARLLDRGTGPGYLQYAARLLIRLRPLPVWITHDALVFFTFQVPAHAFVREPGADFFFAFTSRSRPVATFPRVRCTRTRATGPPPPPTQRAAARLRLSRRPPHSQHQPLLVDTPPPTQPLPPGLL